MQGRHLVSILAAVGAAGCAADDTDTYDVRAQAIGVAPVNTLPAAQTTNEDSPLFFTQANGNPLGVVDLDNATLTVQVIVTNGTFTLDHTTGLVVTGDGTASVTASGPITALNVALDGASFLPAANYFGPASLQMNSSDSNGESDLDVLAITVTSFNDPPVNGVGAAAQAATEDVPRSFNLSVADVDVAGAPLVISLTASNATRITLPATTGLTFSSGDGTADAAMTFTGALPDVNAALNGLVVTPPLDYIGASTLAITSDDQGASGAGLPGADADTITITWAAVNDPPINAVPGAQAFTEDTTRTFGVALGNALTVSDVDATTALVQVTLLASAGAISLGNPGVVTFTSGDGVDDPTMTFLATVTNLTAALDGTVYAPAADFAGAATLTMISNDLGNSGSGGARTDTDVVALQVLAVNDAPVNAVPGAQLTNEDIARTFSATDGNPIRVADVDAPSVQVTLAAASGVVTLGSRGGLSFQSGDGVADATTTFTGTIAALNAALDGTRFTPPADFHGATSMTVTTSDLGATGAGGTLTDQDTIAITVTAVNDAPTAGNDALTVAEDAAATAVAVLANDSFAPDLGETLAVTGVGGALHGVTTTDGTVVTYRPAADYHGADSFLYTLSDGAGGTATATVVVTVVSVNDDPTAIDDAAAVVQNSVGNPIAVLTNDGAFPDVGETLTITAVGTPAHGAAVITTAGTRISYTPDPGYSGADAFTYTIADGNGGADTATVTIDVAAVITQPVNTLPGPQTIVEDSPLVFAAASGNALRVADANNTTLTVQLQVDHGTLTLAGTTGLTVAGNGTASVTASGPITTLNARLDGARFTPTADFHGATALTVYTSDSSGETDLDVLTLVVTSFNDPPVNTVPAGVQAATEDAPRTFGTISIADVDLSGAELAVTLTATNGTTITLAALGGLTFTTGDGRDDPELGVVGTLAAINAALNGVTITPPANYIGASALVIASSDQGGTGAGVVGVDTDSVALSWTAVNDPPVNAVPGAQVVDEDTTLGFGTSLGVTDVDAIGALVQVTLTATGGVLTLGTPSVVTFTSGDGTADATMTFSATLAVLDAALDGTTYTPAPSFAGAATVTMTTSDLGNSGSGGVRVDTDVIAIEVRGANDAPVNTVPGAQLTNEDIARSFSAANGNRLTVADVDATSLQVTLTATGGTATLGGKLGLTFQSGDGTADAVATFTGTIAALNTALDGTTFAPLPDLAGAASLTITTDDLGATGAGGALSDQDTVAITVAPVNDAPTAVNDARTVAEDAAATTIAVLANDSFAPDAGETLSVAAVGAAVHGATSTDGTTVSYQPMANFYGPDSFTYTLSDGAGGTATATVVVTVTGVNDDPAATDDTFAVVQSSVGNTLAVLTNDGVAPDVGETLTITAVGTPLHGAATIVSAATRISYTPEPGYSGADTFTYAITDGNGGADVATVTIDVEAVVTQPINTLPGPQTIVEDTPLVFSTAAGNPIRVADGNNTTLSVQILVTGGTFTLASTSGLTVSGNGTASVTASGLVTTLVTRLDGARYTPALDFHGAATLTLFTSDSSGETDLDVLTLAVTSFNDPPVNTAPTGAQAAIEDAPRTFGTISIADVDLDGAELAVTLTANNGTVISLPTTSGLTLVTGDGNADPTIALVGTLARVNVALNGLTITAPAEYIGPSTLVITSNDQGGSGAGVAGQDTDTVSLSWAAVNDAPVNAVPGAQATLEEEPVVFAASAGTALALSDLDAAAGTMQVQLVATGGVVTLGNPGGVTFTAGDGVADPTMTFRATLPGLVAALDGTTYQPSANFTGTGTLTMVSNDLGNTGGAARTDSDVVAIVVGAINDAPVITVPAALATTEDVARIVSAAQGNAITVADVDATALQVSLTAGAATLTLGGKTGLTFQAGDGTADATMTFIGTPAAINSALGGMSVIPAPQFSGVATLSLVASDLGATGLGGPLTAEASVTMTVAAVNDAPDAVADAATTSEDAVGLAIEVLANDTFAPDTGETLTITALGAPAHGAATILPGATSVTYTPVPDYQGADSFSYTIGDGNGGADTATVSVTVLAVNDPPTAVADSYTVAENATATTLAVRGNDSALPDTGETLAVVGVTAPAHGTATINGTTTISYRPTAGYHGGDAFDYTLGDGNGGFATATVSITVTSVDTQPVATADALAVTEDGSGRVVVLGNDTGLGDAPLALAITTAAAHGAAVVDADLAVTYTPAPDYHGADAFAYTITDEDGDVATATVTVTVGAVDDAPAAVADALTVVEDTETSLAVLDNDAGLGDAPVVVTITVAPSHGAATVTAGSVTYTPAADFAGADTFRYVVRDADGDQATALASVTVTPVNDAPVAVADVASSRTDEARTLDVLANDHDVDGDALAITAVTTPAHGTAAIAAGAIVYTPAAGFTGADALAYTITDGHGEDATATVALAVGLDGDGDGLLDLDEVEVHGTDPARADTDGDALTDGVEVLSTATDPVDDDTDDDGLLDGHEDPTSPLEADSDGDGLPDGTEAGLAAPEGDDTDAAGFTADADPSTTTDPTAADTDGGGLDDGDEDEDLDGEVDRGETDPNDPDDDVRAGDDGGGCSAGGDRATGGLIALLLAGLVVRRRRAR